MQRIIDLFGGVNALAKALGVRHGAITLWRARGIPVSTKYKLLRLAREQGVALTIEDLEAASSGPDKAA